MASRFRGRDYNSLRTEILEFLRQRLPANWDYTNLADPVVIFAEALSRVGDQLHFTVDELRRECDMATAQRRSSIYSYALREGYRMMLPKCSSGVLDINLASVVDDLPTGDNILHLRINKFDKIKVNITGASLYAVNSIDADLHPAPDEAYIQSLRRSMEEEPNRKTKLKKAIDYSSYSKSIYNRTQHLKVVLGNKGEYNFAFSDINNDSTVSLPDPLIDRDLIKLTVNDKGQDSVWECVDDIIGSGFVGKYYSLTPKFIGGAISLSIEFPTNYRDLFSSSASFKFEYVKTIDQRIDDSAVIDLTEYLSPAEGFPEAIVDSKYIEIDIGNGIRGYTEYEDPNITREHYKSFTQDYSALLTKEDYTSYIKATSTANCKVFDHSDCYRANVLPPDTDLFPRVIYVLTDAEYSERKRLFEDLQERSSRSDCICMIPYGRDPYTIIVKAECFLLGTSVSDISTKIKAALLQYYSDEIGNKIPNTSTINYIVHSASDKVVTIDNLIVRDSTFGFISDDFSDVLTLSNDTVDKLFNAIKTESDPENRFPYLRGHIQALENMVNEAGQIITDEAGNPITQEVDTDITYNKYPVVTYNQFPDSFPKIYYSSSNNERVIDTYEELIDTQLVYGATDSRHWDYKDDEIFDRFTKDDAKDCIDIKPDYIKHHYMMPYLNRVIVLIKAVGN